MPGREYELGDLARLPRILYEAFQERRSVDIRNKPRHETPTIQQTSNSKPSVSTPYSRTLPALPRPRYCIGLVGTEQEKQALQKERLTKFMIQQATGRRFASCSGSFEGCWGVLPIDSDAQNWMLRKYFHGIAALRSSFASTSAGSLGNACGSLHERVACKWHG